MSVSLTVHRGTRQIGGSCVEVGAEGQRLILDLGLPLVAPGGEEIRRDQLVAGPELVAAGIAPDVAGLYAWQEPDVAAVVLTHVHPDHAGLGAYVHPRVPVYATQGTQALLNVSTIFLRGAVPPANRQLLPRQGRLQIGPFTLTPIAVDHSAPDAVALLVEAGGKRILYSGDLRAHGRKSALFTRMLAHPPQDVDLLLLEGTTIGRPEARWPSEQDLEQPLVDLLRRRRDLAILFCSAMNLDRVVTSFRAAKRTGRTLVMDLYTAYTMDSLRCLSSHLPQHDWPGVRVVPWAYQQRLLEEAGRGDFVEATRPRFIGRSGIAARRAEVLLLGRSNRTLESLEPFLNDCTGVTVIWSMWDGYWAKDQAARPFCERWGIEKLDLHTSGHASWQDLQALVHAVGPRRVAPVHTEHPERFAEVFENALLLQDGRPFEMP